MVVLIAGASHTGKTLLAQRLLERYGYPYLSLDLLKMGLIRSGNTSLTPEDDRELEAYLWPIAREMIRTAIENRQNLVVEGCYIPFDWRDSFSERSRREIRCCCLVMSRAYIQAHFDQIRDFANVIEHRLDDSWCTREHLLAENRRNLELGRKYGWEIILIQDRYEVEFEL